MPGPIILVCLQWCPFWQWTNSYCLLFSCLFSLCIHISVHNHLHSISLARLRASVSIYFFTKEENVAPDQLTTSSLFQRIAPSLNKWHWFSNQFLIINYKKQKIHISRDYLEGTVLNSDFPFPSALLTSLPLTDCREQDSHKGENLFSCSIVLSEW